MSFSSSQSVSPLLNTQCALANLLLPPPLQTQRRGEFRASRGKCLRGPLLMGLALRSSLHTAKKLLGSPSCIWGRNSQRLPSWRSLTFPSIILSASRLSHQEALRSPTRSGDQSEGSRPRRGWPFRSPPTLDVSRRSLGVSRLSRKASSGNQGAVEVRPWTPGPQV